VFLENLLKKYGRIGFTKWRIDFYIIKKPIQEASIFSNPLSRSGKNIPVLWIIKFLPQELSKGLDRDEGVLIRWTNSIKKIGRGAVCLDSDSCFSASGG